jgi:hypothetical protein
MKVGNLVQLKTGRAEQIGFESASAVGVVTEVFEPTIENPIRWVVVQWGTNSEEMPDRWLEIISE